MTVVGYTMIIKKQSVFCISNITLEADKATNIKRKLEKGVEQNC